MPKTKKPYQIKAKSGVATIKIIGGFGWWENESDSFTRVVDQLLGEGVTDVRAYMNSPGGDMVHANEIGNQVSRFSGHKYCKLGAICASAATIVSTYFDEVEASSNTQYMIHDPIHTPLIEHEHDYESNKQLYVNLRNDAVNRYVGKTGLTFEEVSEMMVKTTWMNAEQAKEKGFIDNVNDSNDDTLPADTKAVAAKLKYDIPTVLNTLIKPAPSAKQEEEEDEGEDPTKISNKSKSAIMKNQILVLLTALGITSVSNDSADGDVVNALKNFVNDKINAIKNLVLDLGLSLPDNYTGTDLRNAVKNEIKKKDDKITELEDKVKKFDTDKLDAILDIKENDEQAISNAQRKQFEAMAEKVGVDAVIEVVNAMVPRQGLINKVNKGGGSSVKDEGVSKHVYARMAALKKQREGQN